MAAIADNDDVVALHGLAFDDALGSAHVGTGRVNDLEAALDKRPLDRRRNAVSANQDRSGGTSILPVGVHGQDARATLVLGQLVNALGSKQLESLAIVDQGAVSQNATRAFVGDAQRKINSASDAPTESCRFRKSDGHRFTDAGGSFVARWGKENRFCTRNSSRSPARRL
jgi:hypothetical protein